MTEFNNSRAAGGAAPFIIRKHNDGLVHLRLNDSLRDAIGREFAHLGYITADENVQIARLKSILTHSLGVWGVEYLSRLATGSEGEGAVIFENLPYEAVFWSPPPGAPAHSAKQTSLSEHLLLAFSAFFGDAYGVASEGHRLVNDLIPAKADIHRYTGNGSRQALGLHTENAALRFIAPGHDFSPKGLLLTGVSMQKTGGPVTPVAIASRAIALLPAWAVTVLRDASVEIALPERQRKPGERIVVGPVPVILGPVGKEEVVAAFYGDMMRPVSTEAARALALLGKKLSQVATDLRIEPGVMVYIANGRVLHGRSNFEPVFDQDERAQRWLQRVFVTGRLDAFLQWPRLTDRMFDLGGVSRSGRAAGRGGKP